MRANETPVSASENKSRPPKYFFPIVLFGGTIVLVAIASQWHIISTFRDSILVVVGNQYQKWFEQQQSELATLAQQFDNRIFALKAMDKT
jgi:hypothetical protein